jgi:hypothetical protein
MRFMHTLRHPLHTPADVGFQFPNLIPTEFWVVLMLLALGGFLFALRARPWNPEHGRLWVDPLSGMATLYLRPLRRRRSRRHRSDPPTAS